MSGVTHYAYLHGFGSNTRSKKGLALAETFAAAGVSLDILDLNQPTFARLTLSAQLDTLTRWAADKERVSLIGSSMGAWVASRFAELNPSKIERLLLLAPGFHMVTRWPELLGDQAMTAWRTRGSLPFPDGDRVPTAIHWGFIEDALTHPTAPMPAIPTLVIHGTADAVVPVATARAWVADHPSARLIELADDHQLIASLPRITSEAFAFFGIAPSPG
jgi:pimeloyl-ACP methyl ester carboxylesterase